MAKWILLVGDNCADAAREAEFREWWEKIHLPDFSETRGTTRGTLYELVPPVPETEHPEEMAKFVAVVEVEADTADDVQKALRDNMGPKKAEKGFSELKVPTRPAPLGVYRQISSLSK